MNAIASWLNVKNARAQIPNTLTMTRLAVGLAFPWLPASWWMTAMVWGMLSEFLDGFLARRMGVVSAFGQLMDPVADKVFVIAAASTFLRAGLISMPELFLVAARDVFVAVSSLILLLQGQRAKFRDMVPSPLGKWTTALQLVTLFGLPLPGSHRPVLIYVTGLISVLAAMDYARRFMTRALRCSNSSRDGSKSHS